MILKHHPEADTDENGELSDAEFGTFRAQRLKNGVRRLSSATGG